MTVGVARVEECLALWGVALPLEAALNDGVGVVLLGLWCCVAQLDLRQARFGVAPHACAVLARESGWC